MLHGHPAPFFMNLPWTRKRNADEVPTTVAVAVADFCRRAGAPAPPAEVRDALSALGPDDDFRVRALADGEPPLRPLGPYAVVDVLAGTAPALAARRQESGYYLLARELLAREHPCEHSSPHGAPGPGDAEPRAAPPPAGRLPASPGGAEPRPRPPAATTVAERIAPKRRTALTKPADVQPAAPRGRFTQLPAEPPALEGLDAERLADLLAQHAHRPALLRALSGGRTPPLTPEALDAALERSGLLERTARHERTLVLAALEEHGGALGRAAWSLGVRPPQLSAWVEELGLAEQVERLRERFRRQALAPAHWTARLDLLGKRKYLEDLGISADFERELSRDLRHALETTEGSPAERTGTLASRLGVAPQSLRRSLLRLGLLPP